MSNATKKVPAQTPFGKTEWFSLTKPDQYGNYTSVLVLEDSPETHALIAKIESVGEGRMPFTKEADGTFKLRLKGKSKGMKKDGTQYVVNPPVLYNATGGKIDGLEREKLNVGNGSELRANIELSSYAMVNEKQELVKGVSCKVKAVQIAKIVEFQSEELGFDAVELAVEGDSHGEAPKASGYDF